MKYSAIAVASFLFIAFLSGCAEKKNAETVVSEGPEITYVEELSDDKDKYIASLAVEGMACEMMCGNMISGALAKLEGVQETQIDFNGADQENFVLVEFDANAVSEKEMVSTVQALADGHYKVSSVKVTHFKSSGQVSSVDEDKAISYNNKLKFDIPNIFGVFSRLF